MPTEYRNSGITIYRNHQPIEKVCTAGMDIELLSSGDGTEIIRIRLAAQVPWAMGPSDGWNALEYIYVLRGRLQWVMPTETVYLDAGDSLRAFPIKQDVIITAEVDSEFLYVSSQPVFHLFSRQMMDLSQLAVRIEEKDGYTVDHCHRIMELSMKVGQTLNLSSSDLYSLHLGSFLHDVGKVKIPEHILQKPGKLTESEWEIIKQHPSYGRDILMESGLPFLEDASIIVEQHHERYNGSGYPYGLREEISLGASIVAVVDSFDAMTTNRVYRKGMAVEDAVSELYRLKGTLYHPDVVEAFMQVVASPVSGGDIS